MKARIYIFISILIFIAAAFLFYKQSHLPAGEVRIGNERIKVEIAGSPSLRERGLSGRKQLKEGQGMLFIFSERGYYPFWMKDMLFPIDIIWIDGQTIVEIAPNIPPPAGDAADLPIYRPRAPANFVLEVPAGMAAHRGWKIGDGAIINY